MSWPFTDDMVSAWVARRYQEVFSFGDKYQKELWRAAYAAASGIKSTTPPPTPQEVFEQEIDRNEPNTLREICVAIERGYELEFSGMDDVMVNLNICLSDRAKEIIKLIDDHADLEKALIEKGELALSQTLKFEEQYRINGELRAQVMHLSGIEEQ